jgi:DNA-binding transcriptional LysR family regulator
MDPDRLSRPAVNGRARAVGDLELRHLLSFRAVARTGSFHEAADQLGYAQSAISQHIGALEGVLGVRLFDRPRGRRTIVLTEAGALLLRHADAIAARVRAARADLDAYAAGVTGTLRVGTYQSVGMHLLPSIIAPFKRAWPDVEVELTEHSTDDAQADLIEAGVLDLSFGVYPLPDGPFDGVELFRDPYVLVVPSGSPLAELPPCPPLRLIGDQPLIGFRSRRDDAVEALLRQNGCEPRFVFRSVDNGMVQAMVSAGIGVALVPRLAVDVASTTIVVIRTDLPPRQIALMWHRDRYRSSAARAFVKQACRVAADLQQQVAPDLVDPA